MRQLSVGGRQKNEDSLGLGLGWWIVSLLDNENLHQRKNYIAKTYSRFILKLSLIIYHIIKQNIKNILNLKNIHKDN